MLTCQIVDCDLLLRGHDGCLLESWTWLCENWKNWLELRDSLTGKLALEQCMI